MQNKSFKSTFFSFLKAALPKKLRHKIFTFGFNLAPDKFHEFAFKYANAPNMKLGLTEIRGRGFNPQTIVDVGAFKGDWSQIANEVWPAAKIAMFEPNEENKLELTNLLSLLNAQLYVNLLGAENDLEVEFYIMGTGSSVFEERGGVDRFKVKKKTKTLDSILFDQHSLDLLKVDAQGYELEILKGAKRLLPHTKAVILEVSLIQMNKQAPLLAEVLEFMDAHNFVTYEILEAHRRLIDNALIQIDIFFLQKDSFLLADKRFSEGSAKILNEAYLSKEYNGTSKN